MIQRSGVSDDHSELKKETKKHTQFHHERRLDFHFIENVKVDNYELKNLQKKVKFIKNPNESAGDDEYIHIKE